MISKKRLEELIEQGKPIYSTDTKLYGCVQWLELENQLEILEFNKNGEVKLFIIDNGWWHWFNLNDLYEDLEDVKWLKEFGCIKRTERLVLPTWEEFKNDGEFSFLDKQGFEWDLYSPDDETRISLVGGYNHFEYEYSKENYILACRKAKELFLGEKDE